MKRVAVVPIVASLLIPSIASGQVGTAFSYQGRLLDNGAPATGTVDVQMVLYNAPVGGSQEGPIVTLDDVAVTSGVFTATLDFGDVFEKPRFLEIAVRPGDSTGIFNVLSPRQELTPVPQAVFSARAATATTVAGLTCADNEVAKWNGSGWTCGADDDLTPPTASAPLSTVGSAFTLTVCGPNQIYKMNAGGSAWGCAFDVDTNTTYSAGAGLQLVGTQFSIDANVARKDAAAGNQAFDTNTLVLDYTNNRVGIGTSIPSVALDVVGTLNLINGGVNVNGGVAAADVDAPGIVVNAQAGGVDGGDGGDSGGTGGSITFTPGSSGPGRSSGAFSVNGATAGAATSGSQGGEGSDVTLNAGNGGSSAFVVQAGSGGDIGMFGGAGGTNTGGGLGGVGGQFTFTTGSGGTNGGGGAFLVNGGTGNGTGRGGDIRLTSGGAATGAAGEITLIPGNSVSGVDGVVEIGAVTSQLNTTPETGPIKMHVVNGDLNFTAPGDGIILRSPGGACYLLAVGDFGALTIQGLNCP